MRVIRWLAVILLVVVVAVIGVVAYISITFNPDDHRARVIEVVKDRTGRDLVIGEPISFTYYPWFGIRLRDVSLQNAEGFGDEPFARFDELSLRVNLVPLMDGHLVLDTIALDGMTLNLRRLQDGKDNWSELIAEDESELDSTPQDNQVSDPGAMDSWIQDYTVRGVKLVDGVVRLHDEQAGASYELKEIKLETGSIAPEEAVPVDATLRFNMADQDLSGQLTLSGDLGLDKEMKRLSIPGLELSLVMSGPAIPGAELTTTLGADVELDQESGNLSLSRLSLAGPGGLALSGDASAKLGDEPSYRGQLSLAPMSPRELLEAMKIDVPTRDPGVLQSLAGQFEFAGTADKLSVSKAHFSLDDTTLDGKVTADLSAVPKYDFSLSADAVDIDRYLPPEAKQKAAPAGGSDKGQAAPAGEAIALPVFPGVSGVITLGKLKMAGLTLTNIKLHVRSDAGGIQFDPMTAKLYQGTYAGSLKIKNKGKAPQWAAVEKVQGVQIGPLLRDLTGEDRLEGTGHISMNLTGAGFDDAALRRNTKGKANFEFTDGALKGINLAQVVRDIEAKLKGRQLEKRGPEKTDFSVLSASLNIGKGRVQNNDLAMKTPFLRVGGQGQANLVTEALDYKMTAKVVGSTEGQGGREFADLEGIPIIVKVRGTLSEPVYQPDYESTIKAVAGKRIDQERGKLEDRARDEIQKALKGLF